MWYGWPIGNREGGRSTGSREPGGTESGETPSKGHTDFVRPPGHPHEQRPPHTECGHSFQSSLALRERPADGLCWHLAELAHLLFPP